MTNRNGAAPTPSAGKVYATAAVLARLVFRHYFRLDVQGREHVPPPGVAAVLAANHSSALDLFVAGYAVGRPARFLAKAELTRAPLLGRMLTELGAIPARRDERDTAALRATLQVLELGALVGLAPEGTRSPTGSVGPYDPGFVWLAMRTGARIVPCAIYGAHRLLPKGSRVPRRGPIWVRFAAPITVAESGARLPREELQAVADAVRRETVTMLEDLKREVESLPAAPSASGP